VAKQTREEYLADSLSRRQPWVAEGISRRTYYRRLKQAGGTGPRGTSPIGGTGPRGTSPIGGTGPRGKSPIGGTGSTHPSITLPHRNNVPKGWGGRQPVWADKTGRTVVRLMRTGFRELGPSAKFEDVIEHIRPRLPASPIRNSSARTLYSGYRKALASLPPGYDRWVSLTRLWGGRRWDEKPEGPYEFVDELMTIAGDNARRLGERFDRWEKQWGDAGTKFRRLLKFRDRIKADPLDWPLRPKPATYSDANGAAILAFMKAHPGKCWSVSQLAKQKFAHKQGISIKAMTHLTKTMRDRDPPELEWADIGRSLLRPAGLRLSVRKSCSTQMIEKLIDAPDHAIELYALTGAVGARTVTAVKTLRGNGVVELPDLRRGTLVKLTPAALAKIERQLPIRDGRGAILWEPAGDVTTKHRQV
jgi:hypothetical protein